MSLRRYKPSIKPECVPSRGPKQECPHCGGFTRATKGQTLEQAVENHLKVCPGVYRVNPTKGKRT